MSENTYFVVGMTCAHFVLSVREELRDGAVHTAVAEAGYEVAT